MPGAHLFITGPLFTHDWEIWLLIALVIIEILVIVIGTYR